MPKNAARVNAALKSNDAARIELHLRLRALLDSLARTLLTLDRAATPNAVHEARVQARRLRVLLRVFMRPSAPAAVDRHLEALREIGHYLDVIREADAAREQIFELAGKCKQSAAPAIAAIDAHWCRERKRAAGELKQHLNTVAWSARIKSLRELTKDDFPSEAPPLSVAALARRQFDKRRRRLLKALRRECKTPFKLHRLRLKIKFMRYLGEELSWSSGASRQLQIKQLRGLQTCLGELRDAWHLQQHLLHETHYPKSARALSARLAVEQRRHMREFRSRRRNLLRAWDKKRRA